MAQRQGLFARSHIKPGMQNVVVHPKPPTAGSHRMTSGIMVIVWSSEIGVVEAGDSNPYVLSARKEGTEVLSKWTSQQKGSKR
jgi:hypothetical protein